VIDERSDEEVAHAVQGGDQEAFGILMDRYIPKLTRYGARFLADHDAIEDVVQEVFLKAYRAIQSFDVSRRFSPWIYRIAHNAFANVLREKAGVRLFSLFDFDTILPHPLARETADGPSERRETRELLDGALGQIPPKYREPLVLYYYDEMSYTEIADILKVPVATVGVRLSRGKALMKKALQITHPSS
jgi:RNA polymerase sigma-70 factor (ECF subfamily)